MLPPLSTIKERRRKLGWTQKKLAIKSEVSQSTIAKIERGKLIPNYDIARRIFEALDEGEAEFNKGRFFVKDIMTKDVVTVKPTDDIKKVMKLMKSYAISQIPVIDENGKLVGIITEKNILDAFEEHGTKITYLHVRRIMDDPPPIVRKNTHIRGIIELLKQYPALIVMDRDKIEGIITKSDIVYIGMNF